MGQAKRRGTYEQRKAEAVAVAIAPAPALPAIKQADVVIVDDHPSPRFAHHHGPASLRIAMLMAMAHPWGR